MVYGKLATALRLKTRSRHPTLWVVVTHQYYPIVVKMQCNQLHYDIFLEGGWFGQFDFGISIRDLNLVCMDDSLEIN